MPQEDRFGIKFNDVSLQSYYDGDELLRRQDYFTATKKQFYKSEDFNQNAPGALTDVSGMFLGLGGGGFIANAGTKGLSKLILNQEVKASAKAGLGSAALDASSQAATQIYDQVTKNNGYVDFRDIDLNYLSIVFNPPLRYLKLLIVIKLWNILIMQKYFERPIKNNSIATKNTKNW